LKSLLLLIVTWINQKFVFVYLHLRQRTGGYFVKRTECIDPRDSDLENCFALLSNRIFSPVSYYNVWGILIGFSVSVRLPMSTGYVRKLDKEVKKFKRRSRQRRSWNINLK